MIIQPAKKGYRAQAPIYKSIAEFMNLVQNHPELSRDANFPEDEDEVDYIPSDKVDEVEYISNAFLAKRPNGRKAGGRNKGASGADDDEDEAKRSEGKDKEEEAQE